MNCDCIDRIQDKMLETEHKGKKIVKAKLLDVALMFHNQKFETYSEMEIEVEGIKRPQKLNIVHSFCPFCGTKFKTEEPAKG